MKLQLSMMLEENDDPDSTYEIDTPNGNYVLSAAGATMIFNVPDDEGGITFDSKCDVHCAPAVAEVEKGD